MGHRYMICDPDQGAMWEETDREWVIKSAMTSEKEGMPIIVFVWKDYHWVQVKFKTEVFETEV